MWMFIVLFVLQLRQAKSMAESPKRCFAPVVCSIHEASTREWLQVFPHKTCELQVTEYMGDGERTIKFEKGDKGDMGEVDVAALTKLDKQLEDLSSADSDVKKNLTKLAEELHKSNAALVSSEERYSILNTTVQMTVSKLDEVSSVLASVGKRNLILNSTLQATVTDLVQANSFLMSLQEQNSRMNSTLQATVTKLDAVNKRIILLEDQTGKTKELRNALCPLLMAYGSNPPLLYSDKCFIAISDKRYTLNNAVAACRKLSARLADVYSKDHMDALMRWIRTFGHSITNYWLGMKINPSTADVILSDGRAAPYLRWDDDCPQNIVGYTGILLRVNSNPTSSDQYFWNVSPTSNYFALCEI